MQSGTQARADWRALTSAAVIGVGVGLSLGAAYLAAGTGHAAGDARADQIAEAVVAGGLTASALRPTLEATVPAVAARNAFANGHPATARLAAAIDPDAARAAKAKSSRARELECLTQAVYFEARGESARGQAAVATVVMNRVKNPAFPNTVCGVVYQGAGRRHGCQFSFACDGRTERVVESRAWKRARKVAVHTLSGALLRDIGSATHFHTTSVAPAWGSRMLRTAQVGLHVFYRFNPHALRRAAAPPPADTVVLTSASDVAPPELRIAAALTSPAIAAAEPASPAPQHPSAAPTPAVHAVDGKPAIHTADSKAAKLELPPAPVAKADAAPSTKAAAATES